MEHETKQGQRAGQRGAAINNRAREQDRGREAQRETQVRQQIIGERKEREQYRGSQRTERDGRKRKIK